ncbi:MAG: hypothetical protein NVS4B8_05030 [Herpetosiphon sp.]
MLLTTLLLLGAVFICGALLFGCYILFDRLQTRAETTTGRSRWLAITVAGGVGILALLLFWCCFALSLGSLQALGLNLPRK